MSAQEQPDQPLRGVPGAGAQGGEVARAGASEGPQGGASAPAPGAASEVDIAPRGGDGAPAVEVRALTKVYGARLFGRAAVRALDGVSLSVARGSVFGLLGPNGAGKTTLVKILLGICGRTGGDALVLGRPVPDSRIRRRVGYLPEGHRFPGYLTGEEALDFFGALAGLRRRERKTRAAALLERVGLAQQARRKVRGYSKGMVQRLGLAQALLGDPDLLVLDEPTDGVDPVGRRQIRDMILELRGRGKTVVVSSHILSEIELVCDRVAVLNAGRLLYEGSVAELTREAGAWEVTVANPSDAVSSAMARVARYVVPREQGSYLVGLTGEEELDFLLEALRAAGGRLRRLDRHRATLEERVVALLRSERVGP